jgi:Tfp pilus assembly protein PilV
MHPELKAMAQAEMQRRRDRIARNNARFDRLLSQMTDKQANAVSMLESNGYKVNQVFYKKNNPYGNVAVMMVKEQVWNGEKGRLGRKLLVAYADGTNASTFEKSISMRPVF